jgi:hypothetical protein
MTYQRKAPWFDASMAEVESLFIEMGAANYTRLLAKRLREPSSPQREDLLDIVARLLDPRPDDQLEMVVQRRGPGNILKGAKRINDIKIALAFEECRLARVTAGEERGVVKAAAGDAAKKLGGGITDRQVREAHKRMQRLFPK